MHNRLKEIRTRTGLNQSDFAKTLGIGQSTLAMLEVGKRDILDRHIKIICSIYDINERWFRYGEGNMENTSEVFSLDEKARQHNLSSLEIEIMKGYMELSEETRKDFISLFQSVYQRRNQSSLSRNEERVEENDIEEELERYRRELEAEKKGITSSATDGSA